MSQWTAAFVQRLRELGWVERRTDAIARRDVTGATPSSRPSSVQRKVDYQCHVGRRCGERATPLMRAWIIRRVHRVRGTPLDIERRILQKRFCHQINTGVFGTHTPRTQRNMERG
jgi:hypothetical protein